MAYRIVLTGGPGAGKTVVAARLAAESAGRLLHVPEAATHVYERRETRWDQLDTEGRRAVQREIYRTQLERESELARRGHASLAFLFDRGSVDGAAYWPDGSDDYWQSLGTTHAAELARYDAVIWLESCAAVGAYDGHASNPCRFEDAQMAIETGDALAALWAPHPRFTRVPASPTIEEKVARVRRSVEDVLPTGSPYNGGGR